MIAQWTLNVEGFGKIEKASVRISPFMIFAGDNNSGKSYMMSLLWGILMIEDLSDSFPDLSSTDTYKKCELWLHNLDTKEVVLNATEKQMFLDLFNLFLDAVKSRLVKYVFNADIPIKNIEIDKLVHHVPVIVHKSMALSSETDYIQKFVLELPLDTKEFETGVQLFYLCSHIVLGDLIAFFQGVKYLPASRTGFMLTYKALARGAVRREFSNYQKRDTELGKLTAPVSHFLSNLVGLDFVGNSVYLKVAQFLESHILQGKIEKDHSPVPNYSFRPDDSDQEMLLHVTSSLVAELSPIVLYLKSTDIITALIIEEPEAHLHLDMQRQMARALVRLVNMGLPVWITTHSDTMVQQINNLIKLSNHSDQQELADEYGYEEIDFLNPESVSVYQFNTQARKTEIHLQPLTSNGFSVPTFSESIRKLTKETIDLMESDNDEKDD